MSDVPKFSIADRDRVPVTQSCKVNGPPGTGKTTQGLCRVQCLVEEHGYGVSDIAWITYRRSLADDLVERMADWGIISDVEALNPEQGATEYLSTAHAVCYRLQREGFREFTTPGWSDYIDFCDEYYSIPYSTSVSSGQDALGEAIFDVYYWLKNNRTPMLEAQDCDRYFDLMDVWPTAPSMQQFAEDWTEYKSENKLVDYHEYLEAAVENDVTPGTPVLVVDEYHDAFPLLHELTQNWIGASETAIILGDPQQVLNHHEGASPRFFEDLDLPEIQLDTTYRVPKPLWQAASNVLRGYHDPHNPGFANEYDGDALDVVHSPEFRQDRSTNTWDAPTGQHGTPDYLLDEYVNPDERAIFLTRAKFQQKGIGAALEDAGVIFRAQKKSAGCWRQNDRRRKLYNALQRLNGVEGPDDDQFVRGREALALLKYTRVEDLKHGRSDVDYHTAGWRGEALPISMLDDLVADTFWNRYTEGAKSVLFFVERQGESALNRDVLRAALRRNSDPTVAVGEKGDGLDDVPRILTIHASKGAEADRVFLYDGVTERTRRETRTNIRADANEDRVWYVGLTRASKQTVIVRGAFPFLSDYLPASGVIA